MIVSVAPRNSRRLEEIWEQEERGVRGGHEKGEDSLRKESIFS